jgi:hypothetical protein
MNVVQNSEVIRVNVEYYAQQLSASLAKLALKHTSAGEGETSDLATIERNLQNVQTQVRRILADIKSAARVPESSEHQMLPTTDEAEDLIAEFADRMVITPEEARRLLVARQMDGSSITEFEPITIHLPKRVALPEAS